MNDVRELKQYVGVHARGQQIQDYATVLGRIVYDGTGPGSWVAEWSAAAERLESEGRHLDACRRFIMARFPYVDGAARQRAQDQAVASFDRWRQGEDIHRLDVKLPGGRVGCWQSGLSETARRPLLLLMGGNVSVKEQWAPALAVFRRLGLAGIATELPGLGENTLAYDENSAAMLSGILDAVAGQADVTRTYALALSFSGHLALRCALRDPRIAGVITVGAPVHHFFTDRQQWRRVPGITVGALSHMSGTGPDELPERLRSWALSPDELSALDIPVSYVASLRDEIIPRSDVQLLRERVRQLSVLEHDDIHGAPDHVRESQLWSARSLLRMNGTGGLRRAAIEMMWQLACAQGAIGRRSAARSR